MHLKYGGMPALVVFILQRQLHLSSVEGSRREGSRREGPKCEGPKREGPASKGLHGAGSPGNIFGESDPADFTGIQIHT